MYILYIYIYIYIHVYIHIHVDIYIYIYIFITFYHTLKVAAKKAKKAGVPGPYKPLVLVDLTEAPLDIYRYIVYEYEYILVYA
jgi:hypothetical protein